jgi:EAL domain-containing protein (putative c-di-GMP-specific phosphodiesterase class I)
MRSEQIVGAEALVRWQHPRHGLIYPDEFIPLAERSGLIRPLTAMVLDKALAQQQEWRQIGHDLTMNVNLSVRDILEGDLAADIDAAMRHYHTDPEKLMLEITETCIATDREGAIKTMHALHNLGTQLAIDDFGTGYSSLSYLKDMPFNEIKVDKSFVMTMRANDISAAITQYIIELGKRLGLFVVAEGVENVEDWKDLIGYGCDVAQGYLISKPIAPDQLLELIRNQTASLFKPA